MVVGRVVAVVERAALKVVARSVPFSMFAAHFEHLARPVGAGPIFACWRAAVAAAAGACDLVEMARCVWPLTHESSRVSHPRSGSGSRFYAFAAVRRAQRSKVSL